jgi:hypothetical protein
VIDGEKVPKRIPLRTQLSPRLAGGKAIGLHSPVRVISRLQKSKADEAGGLDSVVSVVSVVSVSSVLLDLFKVQLCSIFGSARSLGSARSRKYRHCPGLLGLSGANRDSTMAILDRNQDEFNIPKTPESAAKPR